MARYIDADREIQGLKNAMLKAEYSETTKQILDAIAEWLEKAPTADVVEVKHGEWEKVKYLGNCLNPYQHTCGVCGKSYFDNYYNNHPFCPLCGAKMNGGAE